MNTDKRLVAVAFVAMLIFAYFMLVDRYPTVRDCLAGVDNYIRRELFPGDVAADYQRQCREADDREVRDTIVRRMDDEASIRASRR